MNPNAIIASHMANRQAVAAQPMQVAPGASQLNPQDIGRMNALNVLRPGAEVNGRDVNFVGYDVGGDIRANTANNRLDLRAQASDQAAFDRAQMKLQGDRVLVLLKFYEII